MNRHFGLSHLTADGPSRARARGEGLEPRERLQVAIICFLAAAVSLAAGAIVVGPPHAVELIVGLFG